MIVLLYIQKRGNQHFVIIEVNKRLTRIFIEQFLYERFVEMKVPIL